MLLAAHKTIWQTRIRGRRKILDMKNYLPGSLIRQYALATRSLSGTVFPPETTVPPLSGNELEIEQVRMLYAGLPSALTNNAILVLILASVLWPVVPHERLSVWLAVIATTLLTRTVLWGLWLDIGLPSPAAARHWLNRFRATSIATGVAWGTGVALLFPAGDTVYQLFLAFVTGGVSLGAITLLAVDSIAVFGYLMPMLTPLAARFWLEGGRTQMAMVAMITLYLIFITASAARIGRGFRENVLLRAEAVRREQVIRERNQELNAIVESSPDNIIRYDKNCRAIHVNGNMEKTIKVAASALIGRTPVELEINGLVCADYQAVLQHVIATGTEGNIEVAVPDPHGNPAIHYIHFAAERDIHGKVVGALAFGRNVTNIKAADDKIKQLALYDTLTGLPNRRLMLDRLQHALNTCTRNGKCGALMIIDLDNFKRLNDMQGHGKGDLLLQQVARRLSACLREGDTAARLGDDEFVVILENMSGQPREAAAEAESIGKKILARLNQSYLLDGYECHSTQSIGIALFDGRQRSVDVLRQQADLAMHKAKATGRNGLRFFDPEMQSVITARAALDSDVQRALQMNQLILHYQPQVNSKSRMTGAEALVRWQHPERGMVMPGDFIPQAEETGLILPIGLWVLETACEQLAIWAARKETSRLTMSVNVSVRQLLHPNFVGQIMAVIERTGANPNRLKLELTESLLLDNVDETIVKMVTLKTRGVRFSLDDFGTGYSSLSYLKLLPLEYLKIDRSFVRDVLTDPNDAAIARTIVALTQSLGMGVIAEGVETEAQRDLLASYGCHTYQGYLFSKPLPADKLEEFLLGGSRS